MSASRTGGKAGTGHRASEPADGRRRQDIHRLAGFSEADFDQLLERWSDDHGSQDISVSIKLECSGFTLRVSDRAVVACMLRAELERRRQAREA
jgi:hypothetical protein